MKGVVKLNALTWLNLNLNQIEWSEADTIQSGYKVVKTLKERKQIGGDTWVKVHSTELEIKPNLIVKVMNIK
jgi:hypothetical protein